MALFHPIGEQTITIELPALLRAPYPCRMSNYGAVVQAALETHPQLLDVFVGIVDGKSVLRMNVVRCEGVNGDEQMRVLLNGLRRVCFESCEPGPVELSDIRPCS